MRTYSIRSTMLMLALIGASFACSKKATLPPAATPTTSFSLIQTRIFNVRCATTACHSTETKSGNMDLSAGHAYASLIGVAPFNDNARVDHLLRVMPGDADSSLLAHKLHAEPGHHAHDYGLRMPSDGAAVPTGWVTFIESWINAGAPDTGLVGDTTLLHDTLSADIFVPPAPPAAGTGFQLHLDSFPVWPNLEREIFVLKPLAIPDTIYVNRFEVRMPAHSHHFILYSHTGTEVIPPNVIRDLYGPNLIPIPSEMQRSEQNHDFVFGAQAATVDYQLPHGVATKMWPGQPLDFNSHFINPTPDTTFGEVFLNVYTVPRESVENVASSFLVSNVRFLLPAGQVTTVVSHYAVTHDRHLVIVTSHTHKHGIDYKIFAEGGPLDGTLLYENTSWNNPLIKYFDPPITLPAGTSLRYESTYNNVETHPLTFGFTSSDEMMIFMGYWY